MTSRFQRSVEIEAARQTSFAAVKRLIAAFEAKANKATRPDQRRRHRHKADYWRAVLAAMKSL